MWVRVKVWASADALLAGDAPLVDYDMQHDDPAQRRRLGANCGAAFAAGQAVLTCRIPAEKARR